MKCVARLAASVAFAGVAVAQTNCPGSDSAVQLLLAEVRQLRLTLERSAVAAPKIQVALQRIQLQQEQVSRLSRELETVRERIAQSASDTARAAAEMKQAEARLDKEQDPIRHKALEDELRARTANLDVIREQQTVDESNQRARESDLSGRLRTEQAKLDELNERLTTLEQQLETPQSKPQ
jgi:hypothetical protein